MEEGVGWGEGGGDKVGNLIYRNSFLCFTCFETVFLFRFNNFQ